MRGSLKKFLSEWLINNLNSQPYSKDELKEKAELLALELSEFFEELLY